MDRSQFLQFLLINLLELIGLQYHSQQNRQFFLMFSEYLGNYEIFVDYYIFMSFCGSGFSICIVPDQKMYHVIKFTFT